MFGFGKKKNVEEIVILEIKGKVARIGNISLNEYATRYLILLEGQRQANIINVYSLSNKGEDVIALTQPGDIVEFRTKKGYLNILANSFVNKTLADQAYIPDSQD